MIRTYKSVWLRWFCQHMSTIWLLSAPVQGGPPQATIQLDRSWISMRACRWWVWLAETWEGHPGFPRTKKLHENIFSWIDREQKLIFQRCPAFPKKENLSCVVLSKLQRWETNRLDLFSLFDVLRFLWFGLWGLWPELPGLTSPRIQKPKLTKVS